MLWLCSSTSQPNRMKKCAERDSFVSLLEYQTEIIKDFFSLRLSKFKMFDSDAGSAFLPDHLDRDILMTKASLRLTLLPRLCVVICFVRLRCHQRSRTKSLAVAVLRVVVIDCAWLRASITPIR